MSKLKRGYLLFALILITSLVLGGCTMSSKDNTSKPSPPPSKSTVEPGNSGKPGPEQQNNKQQLLATQILQLAQQGKTINCPFTVEKTVIETVKEKWGEPDKVDYIAKAKGTYATYDKQNAAFGFNKGSQIFDIRSYDERIKQITMSDVKEALGTPENIHRYSTEDMLVYRAGENYQLLFIFPKATQQNTNPKLDHYNVFYPRGTVNSMADDPGIKY